MSTEAKPPRGIRYEIRVGASTHNALTTVSSAIGRSYYKTAETILKAVCDELLLRIEADPKNIEALQNREELVAIAKSLTGKIENDLDTEIKETV